MKKSRKGFLVINNIRDLDRLVMSELYAITNETLKGQSHHERNWEEDEYEEDIYFDDISPKEEWLQKRQNHSKKMNRKETDHFNKGSETYFDDSYISKKARKKRQLWHRERIWEEPYDTSQEPDADYQAEGKEFLNDEEEKFVTDVVEWLRPRENKDVIISKIWSLLTESEPESFYYPESEKIEAQTETSNLPEDNKKSETGSGKIQNQSGPSGSSDTKTTSKTESTE